MTQGSGKKNVVDLAEARKRQKTLRVDPAGRRIKDQGNGRGQSPAKTKKIWQYVQLLVFLALVAIMMQLCSHQ